jgi:hypothetical protein
MRKITILTLATGLISMGSLFSQIIAGSGSSGLIISNPSVSLSNHVIGSTASAYFDLNCDSVADMRVDLIKGATAVDGANEAFLYVLNPDFQVCADTGTYQIRPVNYYNAADTLYCSGIHNFANDTIYHLGDYGCMDCAGPYTASNKFIAYRNTATSQIGWIKIIMDLTDGGSHSLPVTLSVPQILSPCANTSLIVPPVLSANDTCGIFYFHYEITPVSCAGSCNGAIHITGLFGGSSPYTYSWAPGFPDYDGPLGIINLCPGNYSVTITDASGMSCTFNFFVPDAPPIDYTLTMVSPGCHGNPDGSICCTGISGGVAPYTFMWTPGGITSACANGLVAGNYNLCITDSAGCQTCTVATLTEPSELNAIVSVSNASCSTCCDGTVQVVPAGGAAGYSITYSPAAPVPGGTCPGVYNYHITDANGCTYDNSATVSFGTGIGSFDQNNSISVFPNPSSGNFTIELPAEKTMWEVELTDLQGRVVYKEELSGTKLMLNAPSENGVYLLRVTNLGTSEQAVKKLVIQK